MENSDKIREHCLYKEWMSLQEQELSQLLNRSLNLNKTTADVDSDAEIGALVDKITQHFQDYVDSRRRLAGDDVRLSSRRAGAPHWKIQCSGLRDVGHLHFSASFMHSVVQILTKSALSISKEEKLSSRVASLQQEMADMPLALIARNSGPICEHNSDVRENIGKIEQAMASAMEEADQLRLNTFKELIQILKPVQAVEENRTGHAHELKFIKKIKMIAKIGAGTGREDRRISCSRNYTKLSLAAETLNYCSIFG
ncbi:hypothetical protein DH2020_046607 [Rehmannia glutinosa]|uniref:DOG1 domain-containing protein n=1 Tax=Rehmannia glutinosa TaxID=99300 RepID=A0ABR0UBR5_REHGL